MSGPPGHAWRIVAPWYRWARRDGTEPERVVGATRPALHKYTSTSFVADYLADPQRSVTFETVDRFQRVEPIPHVPLPGDTRNRRRFLSRTRLVPTETRKLFLPAHQRHYVVAVGLHCDEPGFPRVDAGAVAEAGFVIRRHRVAIPAGTEKAAAGLLGEITRARAVAQTEAAFDLARSRARVLHPFGSAARARIPQPSAASVAAQREVVVARRRLRVWADAVGADQRTEGWVATGDGSFGAWVPIDDTPDELVERWYPMRLLGPSPTDPDHPAHGATIYWGAVPTGSDEITADGTARFSEVHVYELRAFVRADAGDCPGPLVWSAPSEVFRLAGFHDPAGCAQRPTELRMPDFVQLEASDALPSVKVSSPPSSSFEFPHDGEIPTSGSVGANEEICFFAIPLFTIIAMFVLKLFLPIVMFVFGLFWMLKLKFCIPPSIALEADLTAELDVVPGGIQASLSVDIDLFGGVDQADLEDALRDGLDDDRPGQELGTTLTGEYTNDPIVELLARQGYGLPPDAFPDFAPALTFTTPVTRDEVVHP